MASRLPIVIGLTLVGAIGALYGLTSTILLNSFVQIEQQKARRDVEQVLSVIANKQADLLGDVTDYAEWDASYEFAQGQSPEYIGTDLTEASFTGPKLDLIRIANAQGQVIYSSGFDHQTRKPLPFPSELQADLSQNLTNLPENNQSQQGFVMAAQPVMIAARPIVRSDGKGKAAGLILFGKYLDQEVIRQLEDMTQLSIVLHPIPFESDASNASNIDALQPIETRLLHSKSVVVQPLNQTRIATYSLIKDLKGQPISILQVSSDRTIYQQGILSLRYFGASLALVTAAAGLVIWRLVNRSVHHLRERDRMQQALYQAGQLRQADLKYREKAEALEQTLQELKQTQTQLIHSEKMSSLGHLVAGIAHEFNNPVSFIAGNLVYADSYSQDLLQLIQLYEQHCPDLPVAIQTEIAALEPAFLQQDFPKLLASMRVGAERIEAIVQSLRNFSRLDETAVKQVDIHEGLESTLLLLQNRLKPKGQQVEIELVKIYGDLPLVECYPSQLNQVFMNLLNNAIDALAEKLAAEPGFMPLIWIKTTVLGEGDLEAAHPQIAVHIGNNGFAIPETVEKHLFDPFFTTKAVGKGTGLGLAISYQIIVEKHRGKILCSNLETGVEFVLQIPVCIAANHFLS
jgi:two-component system, NtrC family, sensor kinase